MLRLLRRFVKINDEVCMGAVVGLSVISILTFVAVVYEDGKQIKHLTHELHSTQAALVQARLKMVEGGCP